ncbi:restriction endonuclease subunit S [Cellulophaga fucicola]|uniref:restriction endonuclease subunit S n=1 Tax=Cellulophaga fucicola TaxID=76595 RepID=UPI003EBCE541
MANQNNNLNVIASEERAKQSAASQPSLRGDVARNEAKAISSKQRKSLVPKLRFKEFEGEWEQKKLGVLFKINAGGDINKKHVSEVKTEKYKYPIYANAEKNKGLYAYSDIYKVEEGSITVAGRGAHIGITHARKEKFYPIVRLLVLLPKKNEDIYFFEYQINRINLFKESTGVPQLTAPQLSGYSVCFPSLKEQQKIANFLTAVDTKLQQLSTKKETLAQYKKGVMQQLFSQQLRFKPDVIANAVKQSHEANSKQSATNENQTQFPDWEEKTFKEIVVNYRLGGNYENTLEVTNYPLIKMGNLDRGKIKLDKLEYITSKDKIDSKDKIEYGDLFFNTRNTLDLVGKVAIWRNELPVAYYNSNLMYLKFENNFFMNYRLNSYEGIKGLKRFATGTTSVAAIYTKDLLKLKLNIPSLKEQQKIANYLCAIDKKIEAVQTQISNTQAFKKGLLQQMFV